MTVDAKEKSSFMFLWRWSSKSIHTHSLSPCTFITNKQLSRRKWSQLLKRFISIQLKSIRKSISKSNTRNQRQFTRRKFHTSICIITTNTFIPMWAVHLVILVAATLEAVISEVAVILAVAVTRLPIHIHKEADF